jgi:hypothetical protein
MSENTRPTGAEPEHDARLSRGRFDEGQATDEDLATEAVKPHGRFDDGERAGTAAATGPVRGRFDEGQATDEDLTAEARKPHGRYDEGERTTPLPETDNPDNVF